MFLSKKTATFNKPKQQEGSKPKRMLGGWNDDDEEQPQIPAKQSSTSNNHTTLNLLQSDPIEQPVSQAFTPPLQTQANKCDYFDWDALNDRTDIDIEKGLVEQIVKPSGIRIKQTDVALGDFLKEVKFLEYSIVGSLLLSKLEVNYPFPIKAKALYAIEFLVKKNEEYMQYFKKYAQKLAEFPQPEDNVENYRKILKSLMNVIGITPGSSEQEKRQFIDPGYSSEDPPAKSSISSFIHENGAKNKKAQGGKALVGPGGQSKPKSEPKKQTNLLQFDSLV